MKLSILICTLVERADQLRKLIFELGQQAGPTAGDVQILFRSDNREMPTGEKRNIMLAEATGEYVAFFDDDDWPEPDYIPSVMKAIESKPDCVGIEGIVYFVNTQKKQRFVHSIQCCGWYTGIDGYYRTPNHLNPIRREIALQVKFNPHLYVQEDSDYAERVRPLLKTEEYIDHPIYNYMSRAMIV